ncbi:periplasmic heavy metal sensor [Desulfarculus baarsii]
MPQKFIVTLAAALLTLAVAAPAAAQGGVDMYKLYKWWQSPEIIAQLSLSPEEIDSLENLNLELRRKIISQRNQIQQARVTLDSYFDQDPLDEEAIRQQFSQLAQAQSEVTMDKSRFLLEARKILGRDRFIELRNIYGGAPPDQSVKPEPTQATGGYGQPAGGFNQSGGGYGQPAGNFNQPAN